MGHFVNGLKEEIKDEVRLMGPLSLEQAMEWAVRVEEKQKVLAGRKTTVSSFKAGFYSSFNKGTSTLTNSAPLLGFSASKSGGSMAAESQASVSSAKGVTQSVKSGDGVRRLTEKELQDKRDRGVCYRCDDKWGPGHRCEKKELSVLLIDEEDEEEESEHHDTGHPESTELTSEVSLNSVVGLTNPKTMRLRGLLGSQEVIVLIDPGATHNFLSLGLIKAAGLEVLPTGCFGVSLGNGDAIKGEGLCKGVVLQLDGGVEVQADFLPLELGSSDVILGV